MEDPKRCPQPGCAHMAAEPHPCQSDESRTCTCCSECEDECMDELD